MCGVAIRCSTLQLARAVVPVRHLNLAHEYQSKELMAKHGIAVQQFKVTSDPEEAGRAAQQMGREVERLVTTARCPAFSLHDQVYQR